LTHNGNGNGHGNGAAKRQHSVVSLFSGCGGMDLGFKGGFEFLDTKYEAFPFSIKWANDISEAACKTYRHNIGQEIVCGDVWEKLATLPTRADVAIGGFPCQDISINGNRVGVEGKRSSLYRAMIEAIKRCKPKLFIAENVKGLLQKYNKDSLAKVLADFSELGYNLSYHLYLAANYDVPQTRERVFIVGTAAGIKPFHAPWPTRQSGDWVTCKEAIGDLETVAENEAINHIWSRAERSPEQGDRTLKADKPAYTIRAECHGNIQYHYALPRRISMREAARFQSFPDNFIFAAKLRETERQVGNAVPPVLAWHMAKAALNCIE
jgi:DNA (cytosine-5)-methyltransferase 1